MKLFKVDADPTTGGWIGQPLEVGTVDKAGWDKMADTHHTHYDTFERFDGETCALEMTWVETWIMED